MKLTITERGGHWRFGIKASMRVVHIRLGPAFIRADDYNLLCLTEAQIAGALLDARDAGASHALLHHGPLRRRRDFICLRTMIRNMAREDGADRFFSACTQYDTTLFVEISPPTRRASNDNFRPHRGDPFNLAPLSRAQRRLEKHLSAQTEASD